MQQQKIKPEGISSSSDYDDDEQADEFEMMQQQKLKDRQKKPTQMRISVCAEVYGEFNKKEDFKPPVHNKSKDQIDQIIIKLNKSFLFSHLEQNEQVTIALAMKQVNFQTNDFIIKQGDNGNEVYIVNQGAFVCFKKFSNNEEEKFLCNYGPGDAFGELAILYNAPRAASIKAIEDSTVFSLDRQTFNLIVKEAVIKKRKQYDQFLQKIELLDSLTRQEREKISDCLKIQSFNKDEYIIKQGEKGNTFYFIKEGNCIATKEIDGKEQTVMQLKENDYFGELALLNNNPRAANIIVSSNKVIVASIDRASFKRLLGPLEIILQRNAERYKSYVGQSIQNKLIFFIKDYNEKQIIQAHQDNCFINKSRSVSILDFQNI